MGKMKTEAEIGKEFILKDGKRIKSLEELSKILQEIDKEVYEHHVNKEKNDFAMWIRDCLEDIELYNKIKKEKKLDNIANAVRKRLEESLKSEKELIRWIERLEAEKKIIEEENIALKDDLKESIKIIENLELDFKKIRDNFLDTKKYLDSSLGKTDFESIMRKIHKTFWLIEKERLDPANKLYEEIMADYNIFPQRLKKIIYPSCLELHKLLMEKYKQK